MATVSTTAGVTVTVVVAEVAPEVAVMTDEPTAIAVARPVELTVAALAVAEVQVTVLVRLAVVPSVYVPTALNCSVRPFATLGAAGVMEIDSSTAGVTVRVAFPDVVPDAAVTERVNGCEVRRESLRRCS
jgi:hypothetical protein